MGTSWKRIKRHAELLGLESDSRPLADSGATGAGGFGSDELSGTCARELFDERPPDIALAVKELCRSMASPTQRDTVALKRLARYLLGRPRVVIHFGCKLPPTSCLCTRTVIGQGAPEPASPPAREQFCEHTMSSGRGAGRRPWLCRGQLADSEQSAILELALILRPPSAWARTKWACFFFQLSVFSNCEAYVGFFFREAVYFPNRGSFFFQLQCLRWFFSN